MERRNAFSLSVNGTVQGEHAEFPSALLGRLYAITQAGTQTFTCHF